jgi:hypothetical protein
MQNRQLREELHQASTALKYAFQAMQNCLWVQPKTPIDFRKSDSVICLYSALQYGCDSYDVPLVVIDYVYKAMRSKGYSGSIVQFNDAIGRESWEVADVLRAAWQLAVADVKKIDEELRSGQQKPNRRRTEDRQRSH